MVTDDATKAEAFEPKLTEFLIMTTAPRDVTLQKAIRNAKWAFDRVELIF
jgi:hypothetical protein